MKRKLTTVLLALVFVLAALPMAVFADNVNLNDSASWVKDR